MQCGILLVKTMIEEFSYRGNVPQVGLPLAIHISIKSSFEQQGLDFCYQLVIYAYRHYLRVCGFVLMEFMQVSSDRYTTTASIYSSSATAAGMTQQTADVSAAAGSGVGGVVVGTNHMEVSIKLLSELTKTLNEILSWQFDDSTLTQGTFSNSTNNNDTVNNRLFQLPDTSSKSTNQNDGSNMNSSATAVVQSLVLPGSWVAALDV